MFLSASLSHSFCTPIPPSHKSPTSTLRRTQSAVKQNASGYTARQSHAAVWPCCGTTQALPGLAAGVDLGLYTGQHEIGRKGETEEKREERGRRNDSRRGAKEWRKSWARREGDLEDTLVPAEHLFFSASCTEHMHVKSAGCDYCCETWKLVWNVFSTPSALSRGR